MTSLICANVKIAYVRSAIIVCGENFVFLSSTCSNFLIYNKLTVKREFFLTITIAVIVFNVYQDCWIVLSEGFLHVWDWIYQGTLCSVSAIFPAFQRNSSDVITHQYSLVGNQPMRRRWLAWAEQSCDRIIDLYSISRWIESSPSTFE